MKFLCVVSMLAFLSPLSFLLTRAANTVREPGGAPGKVLDPYLIDSYHGLAAPLTEKSNLDDQKGSIREEIPAKYALRYRQWKKDFLSTPVGREQWSRFQSNPRFVLTIGISRDNPEGASSGKYKWNDEGQLVAATITLGYRLDEGYPNPIYFPVMNSLGPFQRVTGTTLAAAKIAHEFGHVNRATTIDPALYELQTRLIPQYNGIFLNNGRNSNDPRLLEMARQIGGTPVEIWEDREYWGEANAMVYLRDKLTDEGLRCSIFSKIRSSVGLYAKAYEDRFLAIAQSLSSRNNCGWQ